MADFLDSKRKEIDDRLKELRPLVEEFHRLEAAAAALAGVGQPAARRATRSPAGRGRGKATGPKASGRRGRPRGTGTRSKEALELVRGRPGITIPELADAMGIKQNYLYRVMPSLAEEGLVHKSGRGWHARQGAGGSAAADESQES